MKDFAGKVAVVTGAASGIGFALSRRFAEEGMRVVLGDVEPDALDAALKRLAGDGHQAIGECVDVAQADDVRRLADAALSEFGKVHVVCNNAGVFAGGRTWECPLSDFEWVLGVNQWGVIHGVRTFVPILLAQDEPAHIVNTASMAGVTSSPLAGAYSMSKHAVLALSETLYHELAGESADVGISVLCPELVHTSIDRSDRNRPAHLKRGDVGDDPGRDLVEGAIRAGVARGIDPARIADRVLAAIRERQFYILSEAGGSWRKACETRLEDIRLQRNPSLALTAEN